MGSWKCANCGEEMDDAYLFCGMCSKSNHVVAVADDHTLELLDVIKRSVKLIHDEKDGDDKETLKNVALLLSDALIGRQ